MAQSLRHEWIPGRIAKDPEEDYQRQPQPQVKRRNEDSPLGLPRERASGESQQTVNDERQRQHHQRIQLERSNRVQVQQLMKSARRPAARTLPTGQRSKWAFGKELISREGWIKEKE